MGGPDKIEVMRNPVPCDWRREAYLHWCGLTTQGLGVSVYCGDKISNSWLGNPKRVGLTIWCNNGLSDDLPRCT